MRTKNGMNIEVATAIETGSVSGGIDDYGEGWLKMFLCTEDAVDLTEETLHKAQHFKQEWQTKLLSLCLRYVMDHGYTVRKAGC